MDQQYIRPFLIYKYKKQKGRIEFEFEDVLREYQMIEDELNVDSEDDEDLQGVPEDLRAISQNLANSRNLANRKNTVDSTNGLLAQYISQKMAKQVVSEFYNNSIRGSQFD